MKLNNKGFALTSIIYMLIVLFLMIMLLVLANLATRKVVLDKIKNDVKTNLNQGGLLAKNTYTVTFDPTIGQINQTSKQVTYNEPYGELPTPTKEGYKFVGWTSKNLAPEINESNYTFYHHQKTTSEFRSENGANYIRINGIWTENIDTMWIINSAGKIRLNQGEYTFSFDIRSKNALATQSIKKIIPGSGNTNGRTGIYVNQSIPFIATNVLSNIENSFDFDNDGEWHHFTSKVIIPYDTNDALIAIGNDVPNLYGTGSYIDIKNIQLEPGDTATSYEPYQEYTSDTIVTRQENHTLYAMWEKKESKLIAGPDFNAKIKQLAGNPDATKDTDDTNITSIQRANSLPNFELTNNNIVSTNDSNTPTYVWFDNGTVYYYTEALNLYMNPDSRYMFNKLTSARKIEVSMIDTSKARDMRFLFQDCSSLQSLNLTNFNVENVTLMSHMFYNCSSLTELDLSSFNTTHGEGNMFANCTNLRSINFGEHFDVSGGTSTRNMFYRCSSLTSLDLSTFNMENVTDTAGMLAGTTSLTELKTPKAFPSNTNVGLPKTMYDTSNNAYTKLGSGSPTETLLKDTQTN